MRTMVTLSAEKMLSRKSVGRGHCSGFVIASAMLILALTRAPSADAAVLNVTDLGDSDGPGQLRTAIASASLGDLIVVPAGIVKLTRGALVITKTLSIAGMGPTVTVIDGGRADRVFVNCTPATTLTLAGLGIQNGVFNGGRGGGIVNCTGSTLRVSDAAVTENSAAAGGGLSNERGTVSLNRVTISRNAANSGGGVANIGDSSSLVLSDVTLTGNQAARDGGGLFNNVGNLTLTNTLVSGNTAGGDGGGIFHAGIGRVATLSNVTVSGNVATASGGGVLNFA